MNAFPGRFVHVFKSTASSAVLAALVLVCGARARAETEPFFFLQPRLSFGEDVQAGARAGFGGYALVGGQVLPFVELDARVEGHRVRVPQTPTLSHQYHESRLNLGGGAAWVHPLTFGADALWDAVMSGGVFYSFASYRGTARAAESGWRPFAEAGVRRDFGRLYGEIGVRYAPQPHLVPFRATLGLGWRFS